MAKKDMPPLPPEIQRLLNSPLIGQDKVDTYPFYVKGDTIYYQVYKDVEAEQAIVLQVQDPAIMQALCLCMSQCWQKGWEMNSTVALFVSQNPSVSIPQFFDTIRGAKDAQCEGPPTRQ